ncbi:UNVERIFIED_CONTAM: hypothetical protein NY603_33750, partial [Bacteroidetes bacterium 56_B9]
GKIHMAGFERDGDRHRSESGCLREVVHDEEGHDAFEEMTAWEEKNVGQYWTNAKTLSTQPFGTPVAMCLLAMRPTGNA